MQMTEVEDENNIEVCDFCNSEEKNILKFGKAYKFENYLVHHFCLLFASALPQNGEDSEGVLGFLKEDIEKELVRGGKTRCNFCDKKGATIGCIQKKCKLSFHYQCSLENKGLFQFFDTFPAWCSEHRPVQSVFMHESQEEKAKRSCGICLELIAGQASQLWAPCCGGFFDSQCVSKLAATSGYFFKCPLCNNKDVFNIEMKKFGIHVPDQDADWDNEPGAYSSLLERYTRCDAEVCTCEEGRNYDEDDTIYEIILCRTCGSSGIHIQCGKLKLSDPVFLCNVCKGPDMAKEEKENESGRRKSLRGKPSEAGQTSATRKLQLEKVVKSPTPSKNPRKTKCSQPNPKECLKSETDFEDPIAAQPVDINNKPKRVRRKPNIVNVEEPKNNVIPELKGSEQFSKPKRGKVKNVAETPSCTEKSDSDPKQNRSNARINSKGKRGNDFILLTDTRQSESDFKQNGVANETDESSQTNTDSTDEMKCPVVIKIDPSILDIVGPGSEDHTAGSELVKSEAHEEELDTELFDLANQINFNFEIPSSPLRPINEATPSKLRTPIKNSPAKRLPKKNLINEISSSPLKENHRGRLRTPQTTPIKENDVVNNIKKNPSVTSPNVSRRSGRKSEQVHETKHVSRCALNLNESNISEVQDAKANNKDKDLLDKEIYSDKSIDKNIQNQSAKLNNLSNARTLSKNESTVQDPGGQTGDTSRSQRVSRKRDCTSTGQSQKGCLPKPCKEIEPSKISSTPQKPLIIKLGVKTTQVTPNGPDRKTQPDQSLNSLSKLSEVELRKNRLEHAKIRVKINELMDKLDSVLASQDYAQAEVVKLSLDDLKEKQKQLEDVANGFQPDSEAKPNLDKISHSEIPIEKKPQESTPIVNSVGGKRKRTELKSDPPMTAEPTAQQERTSKRLRTITSIPLGLPNQKEKKETPEKTVTLTEIKESPRKTRTKGPIKTSPQKKQSDNTVIENNQRDTEINRADETSDRLGTSKCIERKEKNKINIESNPEKVQSLATEMVRNSISSSRIASDSKLKSSSRETSPVQDLSSRRSPRKPTNNVSNEKDKATSMHSDKISSINKSFPKLEDIRLKPFCINLFNINSNKLLHSVTKKRSTQIILHLNKYLINKSGKPHSKQKLLKRRLDDSIRKMSDSMTSIEAEISQIIAQEKLRQNKKIILHLNLKNKSVMIKTITQDEQSNQQKEKVRRTGRSRTEDTKEAPKQKPQVKHSKVVDQRNKQNVEQKDKQSEVRRSGRSRTDEAPIQKTQAKATKVKKAVSETKSPIKISKAVPTSKPTSRRRKVNNAGTAPYPYATETTLEEELFYQICPLKPTSQPKGVNDQSSGRTGEKRNNTRRILISMQKLGRSPILDRPLSFVAFTFDGSNLISHETVDELKERTHNIKSSIKKPINKRIEITNNKVKKSVKLHNSVKKNKISIWKSSKFNSRIKTMISKNGTIQMTVNKDTTSEVPNGLNVSKYFKIRRTSSFSPASNKSTSPTSRHEMLSETQKEKQFEMKKPVVPRIMSENQNPTPTSPEQESVISPMKIKIPKDLWVKAKKDKRLLKSEKKQASVKQRSNASPKTVKVKYKNLYGRVIEYAKNLPRKN